CLEYENMLGSKVQKKKSQYQKILEAKEKKKKVAGDPHDCVHCVQQDDEETQRALEAFQDQFGGSATHQSFVSGGKIIIDVFFVVVSSRITTRRRQARSPSHSAAMSTAARSDSGVLRVADRQKRTREAAQREDREREEDEERGRKRDR